jgi:hypothetical protein
MIKQVAIYFLIVMAQFLVVPVSSQEADKGTARLERKAMRKSHFIPGLFNEWNYLGRVELDSIKVNRSGRIINCYLSPSVTHIPVRTKWIENLRAEIAAGLGNTFCDYRVKIWARGRQLEEFVPNIFRDSVSRYDNSRLSVPVAVNALVSNQNREIIKSGLSGRHIALWPSHGLFYEEQLDRWQWQRARLWQTVEDIFPWSFTTSYLVPMLENAGATVLLPRERDTQTHEVIVDNDTVTGESQLIHINGQNEWRISEGSGFIASDTLFCGENPFEMGTSLSVKTIPGDTASLTYIPDIPEAGDYAVYVSWSKSDQCISQVNYSVNYKGGRASYTVNQCMGAGTWIYLGTFYFIQGVNPEVGSVMVKGGLKQGTLTSDAIRFGGGMGNIARGDKLSGKPRWMEGSRYFLQYAGMPDSLVYNLNSGNNDYNDDYMSRGEWVNFLIGKSRLQYSEKYAKGLNIPVDLALAFHTDAGVTAHDSVIGTLGIYSTTRNNGIFPDGSSKLSSRDLSDIIQTQVVEDIRKLITPAWTRRGLWDREYSEAWRPIVPVMLLELLSHQNLSDMKYGLDPRFRFTVARAVYKGIVRFIAAQNGDMAVIQPLPPNHMAIEVLYQRQIKVSWRPVDDPLEATARPNGYKVYMKKEEDGFDTGVFVKDDYFLITLPEYEQIYSFRVTALNDGGESLPGEILSVGLKSDESKPILIVNAFDRLCGPSFFDKGDIAGIAWWEDEGVADGIDHSFIGYQYDFNRNSDWLHDDSQGWGASSADMETQAVAGNTFSFPHIHGSALRDAGYSFVSVSDEVFELPDFNANEYPAVDLIFGEERGTSSFGRSTDKDFRVFTPAMMTAINRYTAAGGNLFISGAYIGTDMTENDDSLAIRFASATLHFIWRTNHATQVGSVYATGQGTKIFPRQLEFNTDKIPGLYRVESPDAIEPYGDGAFRIFRYKSGDCSAGIAYKGSYRTVVLGFPFETITTEVQRAELMGAVMKFFNP